jgi:hypothetical protein
MAGFAIRNRFAGHSSRGAKTRYALRLKPDHSIGAGQEERKYNGHPSWQFWNVSLWSTFRQQVRPGTRHGFSFRETAKG